MVACILEMTQLQKKPHFTSKLFPEKPKNLTLQQLTSDQSQEETHKISCFSTIIRDSKKRLEEAQHSISVDKGMGIIRQGCRKHLNEFSARRLFCWLSNSEELTYLFMNDNKLWKDKISKINPNTTSTHSLLTQWKIQFLTQEYSYWKCRSLEHENDVAPLKNLLASLKDPLNHLNEEDSSPTIRFAANS